ncbi:MAG: hypothetical protein KDB07_10390, partial [Planctomycetes bacterium]|nr:hypothetical protein [Planctomycetota bacterium]
DEDSFRDHAKANNVRYFGKSTPELLAAQALVLRAQIRQASESKRWSKDREQFARAIDTLLVNADAETTQAYPSIWGMAESIVTYELWQRKDSDTRGTYFGAKRTHRDEVNRILKSILGAVKESGMWGEANPSAYGDVEQGNSVAAFVGKSVEADMFNTFAALRGIEAAQSLSFKVDSSFFPRLAATLLAAQAPADPEATNFHRVFKDAKGKTRVEEVSAFGRAWTLTGDLVHAKSERPILRTGASTAAALFALKVCEDNLSKREIRDLEERFGESAIAKAERDAIAWIEGNHIADGNPANDGLNLKAQYSNYRFFYTYAMRHAYRRTGDVALVKAPMVTTLTSDITAERTKVPGMFARESMRIGMINWPVRRAYIALAMLGD